MVAPQSIADREQARWQVLRLLKVLVDEAHSEEERRAAGDRAGRILALTDLRLGELVGGLLAPIRELPISEPSSSLPARAEKEVKATPSEERARRKDRKRKVCRPERVDRSAGIRSFDEALALGGAPAGCEGGPPDGNEAET